MSLSCIDLLQRFLFVFESHQSVTRSHFFVTVFFVVDKAMYIYTHLSETKNGFSNLEAIKAKK